MCADVNMDDFLTVHHELGHVQYFNQYRELPIAFRLPPCPAFGEAIGDVVAISAFTPRHLYDIGILDELIEDDGKERVSNSTLPLLLLKELIKRAQDIWNLSCVKRLVAEIFDLQQSVVFHHFVFGDVALH